MNYFKFETPFFVLEDFEGFLQRTVRGSLEDL